MTDPDDDITPDLELTPEDAAELEHQPDTCPSEEVSE